MISPEFILRSEAVLLEYRLPFPVPFYTQRVTEETFSAEGYASLEEGIFWSCRSCGIASLRMVLDAVRSRAGLPGCPLQGAMVRLGNAAGAYRPGVGWIHRGLAELAARYGVRGECFAGATLQNLQERIQAGQPCILSVSPRFAGGTLREDGSTVPKGGHLSVLLGMETGQTPPLCEDVTALFLHHPSCFPDANWPDCRVETDRFLASFTGRGIAFDSVPYPYPGEV